MGDPGLQKSSAPLLIDNIPKEDNLYPIKVSCGGNHSAALLNNGDLYTWGQGQYGAIG